MYHVLHIMTSKGIFATCRITCIWKSKFQDGPKCIFFKNSSFQDLFVVNLTLVKIKWLMNIHCNCRKSHHVYVTSNGSPELFGFFVAYDKEIFERGINELRSSWKLVFPIQVLLCQTKAFLLIHVKRIQDFINTCS